MDNDEIRKRLQAFRSGTEDSRDPIFREALERLESDPALAKWFRAEQEFDAVMVATFRQVPVASGAEADGSDGR